MSVYTPEVFSWGLITAVLVVGLIFFVCWRIKKNLKKDFVCGFKGHDIPKYSLVYKPNPEALYYGGHCRRCNMLIAGDLFCNKWENIRTRGENGVVYSVKISPAFERTIADGRWKIVGLLKED